LTGKAVGQIWSAIRTTKHGRGFAEPLQCDVVNVCCSAKSDAGDASALRTVEHRGGLDAFLSKASDAGLSRGALALKREVAKKLVAGDT
jgi:hypothetical protein